MKISVRIKTVHNLKRGTLNVSCAYITPTVLRSHHHQWFYLLSGDGSRFLCCVWLCLCDESVIALLKHTEYDIGI